MLVIAKKPILNSKIEYNDWNVVPEGGQVWGPDMMRMNIQGFISKTVYVRSSTMTCQIISLYSFTS